MSRRSANTTKVFVGSLPMGTTPDELRDLFSPYGEVVECDVVNRCGFLHMVDNSLAMKAIDDLNNTTFKGTRISVEKGRVKPPPDRFRGGRRDDDRSRGRDRERDRSRSGPYSRRMPMGGREGDYDDRGGYDARGGGGGMQAMSGYQQAPQARVMMDYNGADRSYMSQPVYSAGQVSYGNGYMDARDPYGMAAQPMYSTDRRSMMPDGSASMGMSHYGASPMLADRRMPMMGQQANGMGQVAGAVQGGYDRSAYDRRPMAQAEDMYAMGDPMSMAGYGAAQAPRTSVGGYDYSYSMMPNNYASGPSSHRDMTPARRY